RNVTYAPTTSTMSLASLTCRIRAPQSLTKGHPRAGENSLMLGRRSAYLGAPGFVPLLGAFESSEGGKRLVDCCVPPGAGRRGRAAWAYNRVRGTAGFASGPSQDRRAVVVQQECSAPGRHRQHAGCVRV